MATNITVGDGQLATTSTEIVPGTSNNAERFTLVLSNTGGGIESVVLTLLRSGGTERRFAVATLGPNESLHVRGLPLSKGDSFRGYTTTASVVDYLVTVAPESTQMTVQKYDADGNVGTSPQILEQMAMLLS